MIVGYISMLTFQLRTIAGASIDIQRQVVYLKILLEYNSMNPEGVIPDTVSSRSTECILMCVILELLLTADSSLIM